MANQLGYERVPLLMVTEGDVSRMFGSQLAAEGDRLYQQGAVTNRVITAQGIAGSVFTNRTTINNGQNGTILPSCTCNYPGGFCPHMTALLYAWTRCPETFVDTTGTLNGPVAPLVTASAAVVPVDNDDVTEILKGLTPSEEDQDAELHGLLEQQKIAELRALAKRHGWTLKSTLKAAIVDELIPHLRELAERPDLFRGLTEDERTLVQLLYTAYGLGIIPNRQEVDALWTRWRGGGPGNRLAVAVDGLVRYGLLLPCSQAEAGGPAQFHYHWLVYLVPDQMQLLTPPRELYPPGRIAHLRRLDPVPPVATGLDLLLQYGQAASFAFRLRPPDWVKFANRLGFQNWDFLLSEAQAAAQHGLYGYGYGSNPSWTVPASPPLFDDDTLNRLRAWTGADSQVVDWWARLAYSLGLISTLDPNAPSPLAQPNLEAWQKFKELPAEQSGELLWEIWPLLPLPLADLRSVLVSSETDRSGSKVSIHRSAFYSNLTYKELQVEFILGLQFVLRSLTGLQTGPWYDWVSLAEFMRKIRPDFLHTATNSVTWWLATPDGKKRLDPNDRKDWERAYRPILAAWFTGPLRWFRVVDVVLERDELVAVQLTPAGAWYLRGEGSPPAQAEQVTYQTGAEWLNDDTWRVHPGPAAAELFALSTVLGESTNRPMVYRLTDQGIERALTAGYPPQTIAAHFVDAGAPLPARVSERIDRLWSRFGQIQVYPDLTVLELADDLALRELQAATDLSQAIVHQFSPRLLVIRADAVDTLVDQMVKKGYTPRVLNS